MNWIQCDFIHEICYQFCFVIRCQWFGCCSQQFSKIDWLVFSSNHLGIHFQIQIHKLNSKKTGVSSMNTVCGDRRVMHQHWLEMLTQSWTVSEHDLTKWIERTEFVYYICWIDFMNLKWKKKNQIQINELKGQGNERKQNKSKLIFGTEKSKEREFGDLLTFWKRKMRVHLKIFFISYFLIIAIYETAHKLFMYEVW